MNLTKEQKEILIELIEDRIFMNDEVRKHGVDVEYYKNANEELTNLIKHLQSEYDA